MKVIATRFRLALDLLICGLIMVWGSQGAWLNAADIHGLLP